MSRRNCITLTLNEKNYAKLALLAWYDRRTISFLGADLLDALLNSKPMQPKIQAAAKTKLSHDPHDANARLILGNNVPAVPAPAQPAPQPTPAAEQPTAEQPVFHLDNLPVAPEDLDFLSLPPGTNPEQRPVGAPAGKEISEK